MFKKTKLILLIMASLFLFACQDSAEVMGNEQEDMNAAPAAENVAEVEKEVEKEVKIIEVNAQSDSDEVPAVHLLKDNPTRDETYRLAREDQTITAGDMLIEISEMSLDLAEDDGEHGYVNAWMEFSVDESVGVDGLDYPFAKTELHIGNTRHKMDLEDVEMILDGQDSKKFTDKTIRFEREEDGMQDMLAKTTDNEENLSVMLKVRWPVKDMTRLTSGEENMHIHLLDHEGDQVVDLAVALEADEGSEVESTKAKANQHKDYISMVIQEELTNTDTSVEDIIVTYEEHDHGEVDNYNITFKILYKGDVTSSNHHDNYDLLSYLTYRLSEVGYENFYNVTVDWTCYDHNGNEVDYLTFVQGYMSDGSYGEKESQTHYMP